MDGESLGSWATVPCGWHVGPTFLAYSLTRFALQQNIFLKSSQLNWVSTGSSRDTCDIAHGSKREAPVDAAESVHAQDVPLEDDGFCRHLEPSIYGKLHGGNMFDKP